MKQSFIATALTLAFTLSAPAWAGAKELPRWILTEPESNGRTLLLVVESDPERAKVQSRISQRVVHREVFSAGQADALRQAEEFYELRKDQRLPQATPKAFPADGTPLWVPAKNSWSAQDEADYSKWFSTQVGTDFDVASDLLADCADMAMVFRWVYARNNKLPMANTLSGSGTLFGHFSGSADWDKLPTNDDWKQDERFKAAMRYLLTNTYTHSLFDDLYPTAVDPNYIRPGSIFIFLRASDGHTQTIKSIGQDQCEGGTCIITYWGDEPASEEIHVSTLLAPDSGVFGLSDSGFKMWRWPRLNGDQWELTPSEQMPGYSLQQYTSPESGASDGTLFLTWLFQTLGYPVDDANLAQVFANTVNALLVQRLDITARAQIYCVLQPCPAGSANNDAYSTPDLDAQISQTQTQFATVVNRLGSQNQVVQNMQAFYSNPVFAGAPVRFWDYIANNGGILAKLVHDPEQSFTERWGLGAATGNADLAVAADAEVVFQLTQDRATLVDEGQAQCFDASGKLICDPSSPSLQALVTTDFDQALSRLIPEGFQAYQSPGVSSMGQSAVLRTLGALFDPVLPFCQDSSGVQIYCTPEDLIWSAAAVARLPHWSSLPQDSLASRWGFGQ